jgi:hypothetical protein
MTGLALTIPLLAFGVTSMLFGDGPPPACPSPAALRPRFEAPLPPAPDPGLNGSWLDCYSGCIEAQLPQCIEQCGSYDPITNPCLAICYDAIAIGCAIGCTHWGFVPNMVAGTMP